MYQPPYKIENLDNWICITLRGVWDMATNIQYLSALANELNAKKGKSRLGKHYFTVDTPNGRTSRGVCTKCGEVRDFFNSIENLNTNKRSGGRGISLTGSRPTIA